MSAQVHTLDLRAQLGQVIATLGSILGNASVQATLDQSVEPEVLQQLSIPRLS